MKPRMLLVNPPIYDFAAYDFYSKPFGRLRIEGFLRDPVEFQLFDFLDRADSRQLHAYLIVGHRKGDDQDVAASMDFASNLGIRVMLSKFFPLPGTPDGEISRRSVDLAGPLWHNETAFTLRLLGRREANRLKTQANALNQG